MSTTTDRPRTDAAMTDWHIRVPAPAEIPTFMTPIALAFAEDPTQAEVDDWLKLLEPDRWLGAFEDPSSEVVAGCAAAVSLRLTVPGGEVAAAGVTGVGVRPDHRRRGILTALMRRQLADVHERGEPVAVLWASEGAIYQRFGYGLAAMDGFFEVAVARTTYAQSRPPEGRVRIVSEAESADLLPPIYEAMRAQTPGALSRSEAWWLDGVLADPEYSRRGASSKFRVVYEAEGAAEGYAIYRVKDEWDHRGPRYVLEVREAVTTTARALRGLWRYLFDVDLVRTVKANRVPLPTPLQHVLAEPRALGLVANDGLWLRLVDLPAALQARRYGAADRIVLEVSDDLCPRNAGRWLVRTTGELGAAVADVSRTHEPADLVLDTADLAAIYLGGTRPADLAAAGRIEARTPAALDRASAMFASARSPWCVMMF